MREFSVVTGTHHKDQRTGKHNKITEIHEHDTEAVLVNNEAPPLPPRTVEVQQLQLQVVSPLLHNLPTSANFREKSTSSCTSGAINSTSTSTTVVVDIEDSGIMEEPVFLETETKSGIQARNNPLLNQHSPTCMPTYDSGSHECTTTGVVGHAMNLIPYQRNADSITGNGYPDNRDVNHRKPENDTRTCMNITIAGRQALAHTIEYGNVSLSQPLLSEPNFGSDHVEHPPRCDCCTCHASDDHGYVNVLAQSSLSQPLLSEHCGDCGPGGYVNHTQLQSSNDLHHTGDCAGYVNVPDSSLSPFKRQTSASAYADRTHEPHSTSHHEQRKIPSQLRSLPPRAKQISTLIGQSELSTEPSDNTTHESGYVNVSSQSSLAQQMTSPTKTAVFASHSIESSKPCSQTDDHGYINITKPRSISQPANPTTVDMMNSSLLPPRTILRANFRELTARDEKSSVRPLPSRQPRSKTTQHIHTPLPPNSSGKLALSCTHLPAKDVQHTKSIEVESKSSSGCSSGSSDQLDRTERNLSMNDSQHLNKFSSSSRNVSDDKCCCCDSKESGYIIDNLESCEISESVESLDIWPPVVPQHTELMFIVARNQKSRKDFDRGHTDTDIKMITNKSYVKR